VIEARDEGEPASTHDELRNLIPQTASAAASTRAPESQARPQGDSGCSRSSASWGKAPGAAAKRTPARARASRRSREGSRYSAHLRYLCKEHSFSFAPLMTGHLQVLFARTLPPGEMSLELPRFPRTALSRRHYGNRVSYSYRGAVTFPPNSIVLVSAWHPAETGTAWIRARHLRHNSRRRRPPARRPVGRPGGRHPKLLASGWQNWRLRERRESARVPGGERVRCGASYDGGGARCFRLPPRGSNGARRAAGQARSLNASDPAS